MRQNLYFNSLFQDLSIYAMLPLTAQGDNSGVATLYVSTSSPTTLSLDGSAYFYSDQFGNNDQSSTKIISAGYQFVYLKCLSDTANLSVANKFLLDKFGYVGIEGGYTPGYSSATNGPILNINNWDFPNCNTVVIYPSHSTFTGNITKFSSSLENFYFLSGNSGALTVDISDIPKTCVFFSNSCATQQMTGNLNTLPTNIVHFSALQNNNISGDIINCPSSLLYFYIGSTNTITGDVSNFLSPYYKTIQIGGNNTIYGDIKDIPDVSSLYVNSTKGILYGDVSAFKRTTNYIYVSGASVNIYGNIKDLKNGETFNLAQTITNTIDGCINDIPSSVKYLYLYGKNTLSGDVNDIKSSMATFIIDGSNTISGNIGDIPSTCTNINIYGQNTISGDISTLSNAIAYLNIKGQNTISGSIDRLPSNSLIHFGIEGNNVIDGSLNDITRSNTKLTQFEIKGLNTISGNLSCLPPNAIVVSLTGNNTVDEYKAGTIWLPTFHNLNFIPTGIGGLDSTEVDNLFIDMSTYCTAQGALIVTGTNAAPTIDSSDARNALKNTGYTIAIN